MFVVNGYYGILLVWWFWWLKVGVDLSLVVVSWVSWWS